MPFFISKNAKSYYKKLNSDSKTGKFDLQFDFYYLCLIVGLLNEKISKKLGKDNVEIIKVFPGDYFSNKEQIMALLTISHIKRRGLDIHDKEEVKESMIKIIDTNSPNSLSNFGEELMNKYAKKGFEIIKEKIGRAYNLDTFLIRYYDEFLKE